MVYVELNGRLGNYLFQIATAATLAKRNNTDFAAVCHENYLLPDNSTIFKYVQQFKDSIFRNIKILNSIPDNCIYFCQEGAYFSPITYTNNIYLQGTFQSEKFFNQEIVRKLFQIPRTIKSDLIERYGDVLSKNVTSIHVRRGDYLKRPHEYNITSMLYFKKSINLIGRGSIFLVISDDIEWCKKHFKGANFFFADNNSAIEDIYLQSLCRNNIISNSSFSWWGAWLNENTDKIVIVPKPWYGKSFAGINTDDLIPPNWVQIENKMSFIYKISSYKIRIRNKYIPMIYSIKDRLLH